MDYRTTIYKRNESGDLERFSWLSMRSTDQESALKEFDKIYEELGGTKEFFELYCEDKQKMILHKYGW